MAAAGTPAFVGEIQANDAEVRKKVLDARHPDYLQHLKSWEIQLDAFEGQGGFLDGTYLWPYPREEQTQYTERQKMARYHNYLESLIDLYVRFMFTNGVDRKGGSPEYQAWLENVDGAGLTMTELMKRLAAIGLVNGHVGVLVDKTPEPALGPRRVDEQARVVASVFAATQIADWRYERHQLSGVKLLEAGPQPSIATPPVVGNTQVLLWDLEGWARFDAADGEIKDAGLAPLGLVPFVVLRPKPSQLSEMLGRALISNANVIRAHYNRCSEEDEALRGSAFSVLTCSVPPEGNVDEARAALGAVIGTAKALIVKGTLQYQTPDQKVAETLRDNASYLVQEMYRLSHIRYSKDSLARESEGSIRLQYAELNEMLQGFSKALSYAESQVARCWYAWSYPTAEAAQTAFDRDKPAATYPSEFFLDALLNDLQAWAEGIALGLGPTMTKWIKKTAVRRIGPEIAQDLLATIDEEIDALPDDQLLTGSAPPPLPPTPGSTPEERALAQEAARQQQQQGAARNAA